LAVPALSRDLAHGDDPPAMPARLRARVLSTRPHDRSAFTQGLLLYNGELYESTGEYGQSTLRRVDPRTGEVRQRVDVPSIYFAEGLARVGDKLIQLTWRENAAFEYDRATFTKLGQFEYDTEGWGLCYDGAELAMSDGTSTLQFRDPETFDLTGQVEVTRAGQLQANLNELECVGGEVYANIWTTDEIVRIDPITGVVTAVVDASGLLTDEDRRVKVDVLNGIAWDEAAGTFLITGKWWPKLFEVRFVGWPIYVPFAGRAGPMPR